MGGFLDGRKHVAPGEQLTLDEIEKRGRDLGRGVVLRTLADSAMNSRASNDRPTRRGGLCATTLGHPFAPNTLGDLWNQNGTLKFYDGNFIQTLPLLPQPLGSTNALTKFLGTTTLGNSQITDNGTDVTVAPAGNLNINTNAFVKGPGPWVDVKAYGAKGDAQTVTTGSMTSGSGALATTGSPTFVANDATVHKAIVVAGAGGGGIASPSGAPTVSASGTGGTWATGNYLVSFSCTLNSGAQETTVSNDALPLAVTLGQNIAVNNITTTALRPPLD